MIFDNVKNVDWYNFPKELNQVFEFLKSAKDKEDGKYELNDGIFCLVKRYNSDPKEDCKLENHQKYADLQYVVEGYESIGIATSATSKGAYNAEKDIEFFDADDFLVEMKAGEFVIVFPQDYHRPQVGDGSKVTKVVAKIPLTIFR